MSLVIALRVAALSILTVAGIIFPRGTHRLVALTGLLAVR